MQSSKDFIKRFDKHSYEIQKAMQVGAMVFLDQSGKNKLINLTQFGLVDETISKKIDTEYTWAALVELNGVQFICEFSEQIFQPLEKSIGENIRYNWLDVGQRMLVVEALIGHLNNNKIIARPEEASQTPRVLMEGDALNQLLDELSILDVFSLNEESQLYEEKMEALKLIHPTEWVVQFPVDPRNQTKLDITKLKVHMNAKMWKSLSDWAAVRKKDPAGANMLMASQVNVTLLKPFQYLNVVELNSLRCGDAVGMKSHHINKYWIRVNNSPHLIEISQDESGLSTLYTDRIPKTNTKEVCLSFGLTTTVGGYAWVHKLNEVLSELVASLDRAIESGEGGFYVDFYKASRGQVLDFKGHKILQLRDHRERAKN